MNTKALIEWTKAHNFESIIINDSFFYRTNYQTIEINSDNKVTYHDWEYFDKLAGQK